MNYWQRVLHEVLHLEKTGFPFRFTNIAENRCEEEAAALRRKNSHRKNVVRVYALGEKFPGCVFTQREVECLLLLLEGKTITQTAQVMKLSPRTVEFYVKKMRLKTRVPNKNALLKFIVKTDLLKNVHFSAADLPFEEEPSAERDGCHREALIG